jgi:hypothetical protein
VLLAYIVAEWDKIASDSLISAKIKSTDWGKIRDFSNGLFLYADETYPGWIRKPLWKRGVRMDPERDERA